MTIHATRFVARQPTEAILIKPKGKGYVLEAWDMDLFSGEWTQAHDLDFPDMASALSAVSPAFWEMPAPEGQRGFGWAP